MSWSGQRWLIVGCVMLARDCDQLDPKPVKSLMIAVLVLGFLGTLQSLRQQNQDDDD